MSMPKHYPAHVAATIVAVVTSACSLLLEDGYSAGAPAAPGHEASALDAGGPDGHAPTDAAGAANTAPGVGRIPGGGVYSYAATGKDTVTVGSPATTPYGPTANVEIVHSSADCFTAKLTLRAGYTEATD